MKIISRMLMPAKGIANRHHTLKLFSFMVALILPFLQVEAFSQYEKITLEIENASIKDVLKEIESVSRFKFFYKSNEIDLERKVSVKVNQLPIDDVLQQIFSDGSVSFSTVKNQIILKKNERIIPKVERTTIQPKPAQENPEVNVKGTVRDAQGSGIPGVNVLEKGTTNGAITDSRGNFSIEVAGPNSILVFSFIGLTTQEIRVGETTTLNITLVEDVGALSEVVILGYASQSKENLTGAVSTLKAQEIANLPATSVAEVLNGRVAGVQATRASGEPGAASDIVIRGGGSVNGMPPLYIVDGVRMGTDYTFNNQDIESIEVLKDASAAAIYGAQAAGGVILIHTKRGAGSGDKIKINMSGYAGAREVRPLIPLMDTQQMFAAREAFGFDVSGWGDPNTLPNTNWLDELYQTGSDQNYSVSVNGSSDKANYYVSSNYFRQDGVRIDNSFERYTFRVNSDFKLGKKVKVGETIYLFKSYVNPVQAGNYWRTVPSMNVKEVDGSWSSTPSAGYFNGRNEAQREMTRHGGTDQFAMQGNIYLDYQILPSLSVRGTLGANIGNSTFHLFAEEFNNGAQVGPSELFNTFRNYERYTANAVLRYDKSFGEHDISVLAGYEMYREDSRFVETYAAGFAVQFTESYALNTDLSTQRIPSGGVSPDARLLSQFTRVNYSYKGKYKLSATVRRDGSDRFGPENKWGVFPAFSAGWKLSEEAFFESLRTIVPSFQLRASYGALGNQGAIPQYLYQGAFTPQNITADANNTRIQAYGRALTMPNAAIKWEEVKTTDIGFDAAFLNNRLTVTGDWYVRNTQDMIYQLPVALSAGYNGNPVFTNIGELQNKGIELAVNYQFAAKDFTFNIGINGSHNKNEVISLDGSGTRAINSGVGGQYLSNQISRTVAGKPMAMFFGYVVEGIYASNQAVIERGVTQAGAGAGDLIYKDIDGDGVITQNDRDFIGNPWPKYNFGINISAKYKNFDLTMNWQGVAGVDIYNANRHYAEFLAGDYNSSPSVFQASFFNGNGLTDVPRLGFTNTNGAYVRDPNANYTRISSYFVEDGSYLKLRNLQVGYNLPKSVLSKINVQGMRLYFMADNIITLTKYTGIDPEVLGEGTTARGIDNNSRYPHTYFVGFGFNLDF